MIKTSRPIRRGASTRGVLTLAAAAGFGIAAALCAVPAMAQNQHMEVIHHPNYDRTVFMPFVPAIKIKSGKILWLAGTTALPVYHDHPHKREQILQHMPNDLEAQTRATMEGMKKTLEAAGASFKDVVHVFVFRARPRMGDIGKASAVINSYFAPIQPQADLHQSGGSGAGRARAAHRDPDVRGGGLALLTDSGAANSAGSLPTHPGLARVVHHKCASRAGPTCGGAGHIQ